MAGRCGCTSSGATGASIAAGACVTVIGAGTPASPAEIGVLVDDDPSNTLQCGTDGLFAASAQVETGSNCIAVTGDGSLATPYEISVFLDPAAGNLIECNEEGLYGKANPAVTQGTGTLFGGALPADPHWVEEGGTYVAVTDVNGKITVPIFVDLLGILTIDLCIGDIPGTAALAYIDNGSVALAGFDVKFEDPSGVAIVGGTFRVNYKVTGWYAP